MTARNRKLGAVPDPLVPREADLRGFDYMPLEIGRLRDSDLAAEPDAEVFRSNVISWCAAWQQEPAGSLPDDDKALARLLGYGRDLKTWGRVRAAGGLRHWIRASDGRLYHPLVAEKVLEAWVEKLLHRKSSGAGNAKRWNVAFDEAPILAALARSAELLNNLNPQSRTLKKLSRLKIIGTPAGTHEPSHQDSHPDSHPDDECVLPGSQGNGSGTRNRNAKDMDSAPTAMPAMERFESTRNSAGENSEFAHSGPSGPGAPQGFADSALAGMRDAEASAPAAGRNPIWDSQDKRDAYAAQKIIDHLPGTAAENQMIFYKAETPGDPGHEAAVTLCLKAAKAAGVGWVSPGWRQKNPEGDPLEIVPALRRA
jgi:hypothetical protein